ncbi:MAG: CvpA family protein [Clostridiales bacterium]|nr:CvpA family protein [Clostridiales bacterium]
MTTPVIIDIVVAAVLLGFAVYGGKRGLFRALSGLLAVVVALVGAGIIAATFTTPVTKVVTPLIAGHIEEKVENAMAVQSAASGVQMPEADTEDPSAIQDLLAILGLDDEVRSRLAEEVQEKVRDTGASIAAAVVESMARSFIYGTLYILSFAVLLLLMKVLIGAMDLVLKLPLLRGLNTLGGAAVGLVEGALLLFLAVWVLRRLGVSFESEALAEAHILRIFTANTPLGVLSHLQ